MASDQNVRLIVVLMAIQALIGCVSGFYIHIQPNVTFFERFITVIIKALTNTVDFGRLIIVNTPIDTIVLFTITLITFVEYKYFKKGRHSTQSPQSTNFNVYNTMQLDSTGNNSNVQNENRNISVNNLMKSPEVFKDGMDIKSWITVLEIHLKNFTSDKWVEIAVSFIENKILRRIKNLENLVRDKSFEEFKAKLVETFTVKQSDNAVNLDKLTDYKQAQKQSIKEYGEAIVNIVKKLFPNVNDSNDIDSIMQERFVEGLFNQRLRETVRAKMLKMKNIKRDELFKITELVSYAECKNASFDSQADKRLLSSQSDVYDKQRSEYQTYGTYQKPKHNYNQKQNFNSKTYQQPNPNYSSMVNQNQHYNQPMATQQQDKFIKNEKVLSFGFGNSNQKFSEPIKGQALFNNTLINYMCDSGADVTIINEKTFRLIKRHAPDTTLNAHIGGRLFSASSEIKVFGQICLKRCLISPSEKLINTTILVTKNISDYECLLGRDIINRIPALRERIDSIQNIVREFSNGVKQIFRNEMQQRRSSNKPIFAHQNRNQQFEFKNLKDLLRVEQHNVQKIPMDTSEAQFVMPFTPRNTKIESINHCEKQIEMINVVVFTNPCSSQARRINKDNR